jgi:hypothetical protein
MPPKSFLLTSLSTDGCRDRPHAPFRCLEAQYRRELVRVYLTNVETLARKFVDEKREALLHLRTEDSGFRTFWGSLDPKRRRQLATTSGETVLKVPFAASAQIQDLGIHLLYPQAMYAVYTALLLLQPGAC